MKKLVAIGATVFGVPLLVLLHFSAKTIFDYGLVCTKCLQEHHVVEYRYLGMTYRKTKKLQEDPTFYGNLMGHECEHVFHQGGFGRQQHGIISCGITAEGIFFQIRNQAIEETFRLGSKLQAPELVRQTMNAIDLLLPPDSNWQERATILDDERAKLSLLEWTLENISDKDSWIEFLAAIEGGSLSDFEAQYADNKTA